MSPNFVEKQRAARGTHEEPLFGDLGVGERRLRVTEQLAFEEACRERCAVDGDERPLGVRTCGMQRLRDALFAGAGFPLDQHGGVTRSNPADGFIYASHGDAVANQLTLAREVFVGMKFLHFILQTLMLRSARDAQAQKLFVYGLGQES